MTKALLSALAGQPVIVGAGLAGLSAALHLRQPCVILTPSPLGLDAASSLAQGGIAAAIGADDSPELHAADTLAAGAAVKAVRQCCVTLVRASGRREEHCRLEGRRETWRKPFCLKRCGDHVACKSLCRRRAKPVFFSSFSSLEMYFQKIFWQNDKSHFFMVIFIILWRRGSNEAQGNTLVGLRKTLNDP